MEDYITYKCLVGDKGDNVPGVQGVGPKRAVLLWNNMVQFLIYMILVPLKGRYKYIQSVNEMGEQLLVNVELMDLITYCDDALGEKNTQVVDLELSRVLNDN